MNLVLKKAQALAALSEDLQRTNSELEAFSYSVSHDLRAPFRHIIGYAEILREDPVFAGENRRYLETIIESANFGGLLVDNLLIFARIARSKLDLEPISMKRLAEDVVQTIMSETKDRVIDWTIGDLPDVVVDPFFIRLALENLVRNAVKYTRPRARATVEIGITPEKSDQHVMFIKDNGVGFDMQFQGKLFGVFQRLHHIDDFEGTGIGLATVARIIGRHGGRVWASGKVDEGATFYFSLPSSAA